MPSPDPAARIRSAHHSLSVVYSGQRGRIEFDPPLPAPAPQTPQTPTTDIANNTNPHTMADQNKTFNVGIIGYGLSAKVFHIPFIAVTPTLRLHSILQRSPKDGDSAPHDHPELAHFTALEAFLADPELDVVVISTPPGTHFSFAQQALAAGKHIFVEKPFVPTVAEAESLVKQSREVGRLICVYQNRRWDSDFLTVQKLLSEGSAGGGIGRVVEFNTYFERYRPAKPTNWKGTLPMSQGGGVLYDLGSHLLDQVYVLFGLPGSVYAKFSAQRDAVLITPAATADAAAAAEPDSIVVTLYYPSPSPSSSSLAHPGLTVRASATVHSAETRQPRFWIRGTKGSYYKTGLDTQEPQLRAGMAVGDPQFGLEDERACAGRLVTVDAGSNGSGDAMTERALPNVAPPQTYARFYELFARALASGREEDVPVPATQAADVLRIIEAAKESAFTGREVALS
ncbi:scyllo-inositol 2-dehydrogenase (NADP+) [Microdochium nivale]|nr:scyllo-inositol 2-dehydrogenase (NADP+) [Microdochium nivale]